MNQRAPSFLVFPFVAIVASFSLAGCGVKGPPLPPVSDTPDASERENKEAERARISASPVPWPAPVPGPSPSAGPAARPKKKRR